MSCQSLNIDPAGYLPISGIYANNSFEIAFRNYTDSTKTAPEDFIGDYSVVIAKDEAMLQNPVVIHEGANLIKAGPLLTWKMSKTENHLKPGTHYYQIICDVDGNLSHPILKGPVQVNPSRQCI